MLWDPARVALQFASRAHTQFGGGFGNSSFGKIFTSFPIGDWERENPCPNASNAEP